MTNAAVLDKTISSCGEIRSKDIRPKDRPSVSVVCTSIEGMREAMEKACRLAAFFQCGIEILVVESVPYRLPLDEPPVSLDVLLGRLKEIANEFPIRTRAVVYLCRDSLEMLKNALKLNSPVVMSVRKSWWPGYDRRLARKLSRAGYIVILVETE